MPKISVLMPIYNTNEAHLREAIESILAQTFKDFEFLILNDSPDNKDLDKIVGSYTDKRIVYLKNDKNMGITPSRNKLIDLAKGKYLATMDHDDVSLPTRFEKQVEFLDKNTDYGVVGCQVKYLHKDKIAKKPTDDTNMGDQFQHFKEEVDKNKGKCATIFAYHVSDPERFGVVEFDENKKAISIEEKPKQPKSNYASVGLYFYPKDVVEKAKNLKPSARGELEITDLNNLYLQENRMSVVPMGRGNAWLDAGTPDSLMESSQFVQIIEKRQGLKIACIEEISFRRGFISNEKMIILINELPNGDYKKYLTKIYEEYHELH